jgi:hypothetical protein
MTIRRIDSPASGMATSEPSFCVGGLKLLVMSLATFGLYLLYWLYRNWKAEQERSGDNIVPLARAVFAVLFFHSLASRVALRAEAEGIPPRFSPILLTTVFVVLALSPRLPDPWWLLSLGTAVPVLPIQRALQALDEAKGIDSRGNRLFRGGEIAVFAIGAIVWLLILTGLLLPEPT